MAGLKYTFVWEKEGGAIVLPISDNKKDRKAVRIIKSVSKDFGFKANLICPHCYENGFDLDDSELRQYYICSRCGHRYTIGDIKYRRDKDFGVIYTTDEKKAFMSMKIDKEIRVKEEISIDNLLYNVEFFEDYFEIYSENERYATILQKIYKYLLVKKKALLCSFGYREMQRGAIIFPAGNKLLLVLLRDSRLIKQPKMDMEKITNETTEKLQKYSEDKTGDLYNEFIEKLMNGEIITEKKETKEQQEEIPAWLEAIAC